MRRDTQTRHLSIRPSPCPSASPAIVSVVVCVCNSETGNRTDCLRKFREEGSAHTGPVRARAPRLRGPRRSVHAPHLARGARYNVLCCAMCAPCGGGGGGGGGWGVGGGGGGVGGGGGGGGRCGRLQSAYIIIIAKRCENRKIPPDYVNSRTGRTSELAGGPQKLRTGPQNPLPEATKHCFFTGKARCGRPQKKKL